MGIIKQLSPHEAQKIAAGQVVDRPANIIKELVENAIDAHASLITIYIENAGKTLLRVVDNGCGMDRDDAQLCFEKHATSKITSVNQLAHITTFGFRGEALASIAAVSRVELLTKQINTTGIQVEAHEGSITLSPIACPDGTDIRVHDLFYNMPARAKFLKSDDTEVRHCIQTIQALCFAHPTIHFKIIVDGKTTLNCPSHESLMNRCAQLWDHANVHHLITIDAAHKSGISLTGIISNHEWFRYDRGAVFFLVNNRWVTNQGLGRALAKGFANVIPAGRHPFACLVLSINPTEIDVNMHPRKEEIKFAHPRIVEALIEDSVRSGLESHISHRIKRPIEIQKPIINNPIFQPARPFDYFDSQREPFIAPPVIHSTPVAAAPIFSPNMAITFDKAVPAESTPAIQSIAHDQTYILIGQYHNTYILIEQSDGLFMIDQHAAHERILYEQFADRFNTIAPVTLMFPQIIPCTPDDIALISPHLALFHENGISIEPFGTDQLIVNATPVPLQHVPIHELVRQAIGWIREYERIDPEQFFRTMHDKLRAQMACKAAIKAGDVLNREQMTELLEKLHAAPNRFSCPHGRPTGWLLSLDEIEKKFRRKL